MQNHKCFYLDGDLCRSDERCQYTLTTACYPHGPHLCGKDQLLALKPEGGLVRCQS